MCFKLCFMGTSYLVFVLVASSTSCGAVPFSMPSTFKKLFNHSCVARDTCFDCVSTWANQAASIYYVVLLTGNKPLQFLSWLAKILLLLLQERLLKLVFPPAVAITTLWHLMPQNDVLRSKLHSTCTCMYQL